MTKQYKIGMILEGKITGIQPYGAFVELDNKTQGLIHVSEIRHGYVKAIDDYVKIGDKVKVEIIDIDEYSKKISLSLRALTAETLKSHTHKKIYFTNRQKHIGFKPLKLQMDQWVKETNKELLEKKG